MWINDKWNGDLDEVKISVEVLSSQILGKRFSEFPNGSQTYELPEYRLECSNHWAFTLSKSQFHLIWNTSCFMLYIWTGDKHQPDGPLGSSYADLTLPSFSLASQFSFLPTRGYTLDNSIWPGYFVSMQVRMFLKSVNGKDVLYWDHREVSQEILRGENIIHLVVLTHFKGAQ